MLVREKEAGAHLDAVIFWGLTDDNSWIRGADPLLFRADLSCKKSFDALVFALSGESLGEPEYEKIYIETDGAADYYVDEIVVKRI